jgi:hypothetical protein
MNFYVKTVYVNQTGMKLEFFKVETDKAICISQQAEWGNLLLSSDDTKVFVALSKDIRSEVFNV